MIPVQKQELSPVFIQNHEPFPIPVQKQESAPIPIKKQEPSQIPVKKQEISHVWKKEPFDDNENRKEYHLANEKQKANAKSCLEARNLVQRSSELLHKYELWAEGIPQISNQLPTAFKSLKNDFSQMGRKKNSPSVAFESLGNYYDQIHPRSSPTGVTCIADRKFF